MKNILRQIRTALQIIYHILRYHNKVTVNYNLKNLPNFESKKSNYFFIKELKKSKFYFEYGSGSSTIYANKLFKKYISIESDKNFYLFMKSKKIPNIKFINFGYVFFFSVPIFYKFNKKKAFRLATDYANQIFRLKNKPDLILIDGRYRVLCALTVLEYIKKKNIKRMTIILDDYAKRETQYGALKKYYNIKLVGRFGVLKLKNCNPNFKKIKNIYKSEVI